MVHDQSALTKLEKCTGTRLTITALDQNALTRLEKCTGTHFTLTAHDQVALTKMCRALNLLQVFEHRLNLVLQISGCC